MKKVHWKILIFEGKKIPWFYLEAVKDGLGPLFPSIT
jgi:hypothetical protein